MDRPFSYSLLVIFFLCISITQQARAQEEPYGLKERVPNTSLRINLSEGPPAQRLSQTGLFTDIASHTVSPGLIPYAVNSPFWSDGAIKTRYFAVPEQSQVEFSAEDHWIFPPNTVLVKNFFLEFVRGDPNSRQPIETRFMVKDSSTDQWKGFSYQRNDEGTEAYLLDESQYKTFFIVDPSAPEGYTEQRYFYPGPEDCTFCHREAAGRALGARTGQLNGNFTYGTVRDNQLRALNSIGFFTRDISPTQDRWARWPNPLDESEPLELRARSYLAANCAHCHRPDGVSRADFDVRFSTSTETSRTVGISPSLGRLDAEPEQARIIQPGSADGSTLYLRTQNFSSFRMPPMGTSVLDQDGTDVLRRWIEGMSSPTGIHRVEAQPENFTLGQNYPNPFNAATSIDFSLAHTARVNLSIFDISGQKVHTLVDETLGAGRHTVQWPGVGSNGQIVASGAYFYRLQTDRASETKRLILLK